MIKNCSIGCKSLSLYTTRICIWIESEKNLKSCEHIELGHDVDTAHAWNNRDQVLRRYAITWNFSSILRNFKAPFLTLVLHLLTFFFHILSARKKFICVFDMWVDNTIYSVIITLFFIFLVSDMCAWSF